MSNNDNKQQGNFLTSLPGIITALLGSGGLVALIQIFNPTQSSKPIPSDTPRSQQSKIKFLEVYADSIKGTPFTNEEDRSVQISFEADGRWLAIPETVKDSSIDEDAKGYISPNGAPNFISNTTKCPRFPLGALVVKGDDGCKVSGATNTFKLKAGETVYFLMNDVERLYNDNKGSIKVKLTTSD